MTEVLGRPVSGQIRKEEKKQGAQRTIEEMIDDIDAILAHPGVKGVAWRQYTPYFNDGDECEFGVREMDAILDATYWGLENDLQVESYGLYTVDRDRWESDPRYKSTEYEERRAAYRDASTYVLNGRDTRALFNALLEINKNMEHYTEVAYEHFGDHAYVTATPEGFEVEFYDHD